jgi:hypothetical protein
MRMRRRRRKRKRRFLQEIFPGYEELRRVVCPCTGLGRGRRSDI